MTGVEKVAIKLWGWGPRSASLPRSSNQNKKLAVIRTQNCVVSQGGGVPLANVTDWKRPSKVAESRLSPRRTWPFSPFEERAVPVGFEAGRDCPPEWSLEESPYIAYYPWKCSFLVNNMHLGFYMNASSAFFLEESGLSGYNLHSV